MAKTTDQAPPEAPPITDDQATGADIAEAAASAVRYAIVHSGVGNWLAGAILTAEELTGIDLDRLLGLGAIVPHQE